MSQPSVIIATASYDFTIRFWEAQSASCYRAINYPAVVSLSLSLYIYIYLDNNENFHFI